MFYPFKKISLKYGITITLHTFYAAYNSKKKTIKWTDGTTDKVGKKKQYATTVFFEIKMGG